MVNVSENVSRNLPIALIGNIFYLPFLTRQLLANATSQRFRILVYMTNSMQTAYRMFKRNSRANYYIQNNAIGEQACLGASDESEAIW